MSVMEPVFASFFDKYRKKFGSEITDGRVDFFQIDSFDLRNAWKNNVVIFFDCFPGVDFIEDVISNNNKVVVVLSKGFDIEGVELSDVEFRYLNELTRYYNDDDLTYLISEKDNLMRCLNIFWCSASVSDRHLLDSIDEFERGRLESVEGLFKISV